jgi:hypothetical protein
MSNSVSSLLNLITSNYVVRYVHYPRVHFPPVTQCTLVMGTTRPYLLLWKQGGSDNLLFNDSLNPLDVSAESLNHFWTFGRLIENI